MIVSLSMNELRCVIAAVSSMSKPSGNYKLPDYVDIKRVLLHRLRSVRALGEQRPRKRIERLYPFDKGYKPPPLLPKD